MLTIAATPGPGHYRPPSDFGYLILDPNRRKKHLRKSDETQPSNTTFSRRAMSVMEKYPKVKKLRRNDSDGRRTEMAMMSPLGTAGAAARVKPYLTGYDQMGN